MDREKENRCRDLKKNGSLSPSGSNKNCNGKGDGYAMDSYKRERVKGLKRSPSDEKEECRMDAKCNGGCVVVGSEGGDGCIFRSPLNANGISNGKRIKLQGKVLEVHGPVDSVLVPRRLRSAMNKRISQSASPPLPDSKRAQRHASDGTLLSDNSSAERFKQKMTDEVTKDEKEVAEALTSLASLVTISKPPKIKLYGSLLEENPETKMPSAFPLEAPIDEGAKVLVPCNGGTATGPSRCLEDSPETMKAGPSQLEQPLTTSVSQKFDAEAKGPSQPDSLGKLSSNTRSIENVANLRDAKNISDILGASLQYFQGNGMLQPTQLDSCIVQKQELGFWPPVPASLERDLQSFKQKPDCETNHMSQKVETVTDGYPGLHDRGHEQLTMPMTSKTTSYPNSVTISGKSGSRKGLLAEKLPLASADKKHSWKKCAIHVHISHLIRNFQKAEKKQPSITQSNLSKAKEGACSNMPVSGETGGLRIGMIPPLPSASQIERRMLEARSRMLQDGRMLQAQQASTLSGAYGPQKQTCDLLSLSVAGDTKSATNGMKSYSPNQAVMPFTFPRGPFNSQYQEQLTSGTAQQVQLQLPHYISSSHLYGPHVGQAAGGAVTKQLQQQQLMWQAHLAHYRPPVGFPSKWQQNGRQHDSSPSPLISQPPSIFPLPADYSPHNLHQPFILPMPSSASSLSSRSKQQQHAGGLNPQSSSQVQMISSVEGFI